MKRKVEKFIKGRNKAWTNFKDRLSYVDQARYKMRRKKFVMKQEKPTQVSSIDWHRI